MRDKHPIHTTLSTNAMRVLERYEKELGAKNVVLERALMGMDKLHFKEKIDVQNISRFIKRVKSGVPGFDELIEGGIPEGFIVAVTGPPGTGKTTFAMQFLIEGLKNNERCIFFSFEENIEQLLKTSVRFGWNVGLYIDQGFLEIFGFTMLSIEEIIEIIDIFKPKRIVFDTLNIFFNQTDFRKSSQWRIILKKIKDNNLTTLAITEKKHGLEVKEFDDFDFICDGILFFDKKQLSDLSLDKSYVVEVQKMRTTKISESPRQFMFTDYGITMRNNLAKRISSSGQKLF